MWMRKRNAQNKTFTSGTFTTTTRRRSGHGRRERTRSGTHRGGVVRRRDSRLISIWRDGISVDAVAYSWHPCGIRVTHCTRAVDPWPHNGTSITYASHARSMPNACPQPACPYHDIPISDLRHSHGISPVRTCIPDCGPVADEFGTHGMPIADPSQTVSNSRTTVGLWRTHARHMADPLPN